MSKNREMQVDITKNLRQCSAFPCPFALCLRNFVSLMKIQWPTHGCHVHPLITGCMAHRRS
jgi:hypothetical protein